MNYKNVYISVVFFLFLRLCANAQDTTNQSTSAIYQIYLQNNFAAGTDFREIKNSWFSFYKNTISVQISAHCQFVPTCSEFMNEALHHKHPFRNFLLGIDRLTRCGNSDDVFYHLHAFVNQNNQTIYDQFYLYSFE